MKNRVFQSQDCKKNLYMPHEWTKSDKNQNRIVGKNKNLSF